MPEIIDEDAETTTSLYLSFSSDDNDSDYEYDSDDKCISSDWNQPKKRSRKSEIFDRSRTQNMTRAEFNPKQKGNQKQRRFDYESDCSYVHLGFEYKRTKLLTDERKRKLLPNNSMWKCPSNLVMVDFDDQASNTSHGNRLLFESLDNKTIDNLVGLVHLRDDGSSFTHKVGNDENESFGIVGISKKQNPLLAVQCDPPLPPSHIDYIKNRMQLQLHLKQQQQYNQKDHALASNSNRSVSLENSFDGSAAISLGMYLEELLTASFLPLAGLHVLRCRAIEKIKSREYEMLKTSSMPVNDNAGNANNIHRNKSNIECAIHPVTGENIVFDIKNIQSEDVESFDELTLPPDEAILKLYQQHMLSTETLYHFVPDPSRCWDPTFNSTAQNSYEKGTNNDFELLPELFRFGPSVLTSNKDIFEIFMTRNN